MSYYKDLNLFFHTVRKANIEMDINITNNKVSFIISKEKPFIQDNWDKTISKMIEISKDPRFGDTKALLLFENPQDVLAAVEGGVPIESINVGSMAHSTGKTMVNKVLSMDKKDVETFEKLRDLGVKFDVRKVPNDSPDNINAILNKAKEGLSK